jgi:hypothetical protein
MPEVTTTMSRPRAAAILLLNIAFIVTLFTGPAWLGLTLLSMLFLDVCVATKNKSTYDLVGDLVIIGAVLSLAVMAFWK